MQPTRARSQLHVSYAVGEGASGFVREPRTGRNTTCRWSLVATREVWWSPAAKVTFLTLAPKSFAGTKERRSCPLTRVPRDCPIASERPPPPVTGTARHEIAPPCVSPPRNPLASSPQPRPVNTPPRSSCHLAHALISSGGSTRRARPRLRSYARGIATVAQRTGGRGSRPRRGVGSSTAAS